MSDTGTTAEVHAALAALGGPTWRDRKQAADALVQALANSDTALLLRTIESLLDLFLGPDVEPRAGAR